MEGRTPGERLKWVYGRLASFGSEARFAEHLGLAKTTLANWFRNKSQPNPAKPLHRHAVRLAAELVGVDESQIWGTSELPLYIEVEHRHAVARERSRKPILDLLLDYAKDAEQSDSDRESAIACVQFLLRRQKV